MKQLNFNDIALVEGGQSGRACMIMGGLAFGAAIGGFVVPSLFGAALSITASAASYGCFN